MTNLPRFVCVGAGKSGTTALYHYLRQHPKVFLPAQKELQFFAWPDLAAFDAGPGTSRSRDDWIKEESDYRAMYSEAPIDAVSGDISPTYLYASGAPDRMLEMLGEDLRIVVMLRNPVEKVISQHGHLRRDMREELPLDEALAAEPRRIAEKWGAIYHYVATSRYSESMQRYVHRFGRERLHVILFDEFVKDPVSEVREVCRFIGISDDFQFQTKVKTNRSGSPKSSVIARAIGPNRATSLAKQIIPRQIGVSIKTWLMNANTGPREEVSEVTRARLLEAFRDDILALEDLLDTKTGWLVRPDTI